MLTIPYTREIRLEKKSKIVKSLRQAAATVSVPANALDAIRDIRGFDAVHRRGRRGYVGFLSFQECMKVKH